MASFLRSCPPGLAPAFGIALLLAGGSGCLNPEPEPDEPPGEDDPYELLAEQTVGTEGGLLEAEGFRLTIPAGAFGGDYELALHATTQGPTTATRWGPSKES
jgi:hypothetical protein